MRFDIDMDWSTQRPGLSICLEEFYGWIRSGCDGSVRSYVIPCRYGKSDFIRTAAVLAINERLVSRAIAIEPNKTLASQLTEETRLVDWSRRWSVRGIGLEKIKTFSNGFPVKPFTDEWLGSINIQALVLSHQLELFRQWIRSCKTKPLVVIDETHSYTVENKWGRVPRAARDLGCPVVVLTATPYRKEGDDLFGFRRIEGTSVETKERVYVTAHPTMEDKLVRHRLVVDESLFTVEAHKEYTFEQAWNEKPKVLAKGTLDAVDWDCEGYGELQGDTRKLSELPKDKARKVIGTLVRDYEFIKEFVGRVVRHTNSFIQAGVTDASFIIYGMNDREGGPADEHLKLLKRVIAEEDSGIRVKLATQKTDDDGCAVIDAFCRPVKPVGDGLLLKRMGSSGLDSDRICVVGLLHTDRSLAPQIQQIMRGGNVGSKTHFVVVAMADTMMKEIWTDFIEANGGDFKQTSEREHDTEVIDKTDKPESGYIPISVATADVVDTDGELASFEQVIAAYLIIEKFPQIVKDNTIPQIAAKAADLGISGSIENAQAAFRDTTKLIKELADQLNKMVTLIAKMRFAVREGRKCNTSRTEDRKVLGGIYKPRAINEIKAMAGRGGTWNEKSKDRSQDLSDYRAWLQAAHQIIGGEGVASETA